MNKKKKNICILKDKESYIRVLKDRLSLID